MHFSPRHRRLRSDLSTMMSLKKESSILAFTSYGHPPERYLVTFKGGGLAVTTSQGVHETKKHAVEIILGAAYPRIRPDLLWKSNIFHPNISESGLVCLGGYSTDWVPSLTIDRLCTMLWDMIRWANYDVKSPYNIRAARWAAVQTEFVFPVDPRQIRDRVGRGLEASPKPKRPGIFFLE